MYFGWELKELHIMIIGPVSVPIELCVAAGTI